MTWRIIFSTALLIFAIQGDALPLSNILPKGSPAANTAGWTMPVSDRRIVVRIHSGQPYAAWNSKEARIFVPPLNTVEDMEIWRHELRHALEGHWH